MCLEEETIYGKIIEDVRKVWEHYPTYVDVNLGWFWFQQIYCTSIYHSSHIWEEDINRKWSIKKVRLLSIDTQNSALY